MDLVNILSLYDYFWWEASRSYCFTMFFFDLGSNILKILRLNDLGGYNVILCPADKLECPYSVLQCEGRTDVRLMHTTGADTGLTMFCPYRPDNVLSSNGPYRWAGCGSICGCDVAEAQHSVWGARDAWIATACMHFKSQFVVWCSCTLSYFKQSTSSACSMNSTLPPCHPRITAAVSD